MSEQFDPGRPGFRGTLRGPDLAAHAHEMAVLERYSDNWSRLWAISYEPGVIIPDERTMGWWLLAEFLTRQESRAYFTHLSHVWAGRTIDLVVPRRKSEVVTKPPQCPECGGRTIEASPEVFNADKGVRTPGLKCSACGHLGDVADFLVPA